MNIYVNDVHILYIILITFISSLILVPLIRDIAVHINAMDIPDKRKVHKKPMPRLGGLGIYFGFLLGYMIFGEQTTMMNSILIGSFVLHFLHFPPCIIYDTNGINSYHFNSCLHFSQWEAGLTIDNPLDNLVAITW